MATDRHEMESKEATRQRNIAAGNYLKRLRTTAELTQLQIAKVLEEDYQSVVGAWENGRAPMPSRHYAAFAQATGVDPVEFARTILQWHDPSLWNVLFGKGIGGGMVRPAQSGVALNANANRGSVAALPTQRRAGAVPAR